VLQVRIRVTDSDDNTYDEDFDIFVGDVNETPTDLIAVPREVEENLPPLSLVSVLGAEDPDDGDRHEFFLVAGDGDTDNASFKIVSDQLQARESFNYEARDSYSVRIRAEDLGGLRFDGPVTITIVDVNDAPTNLRIDNDVVEENYPVGTAVGAFACDDEDPLDTHVYALVAGEGSTDNGSFSIDGDGVLRTGEIFDSTVKDAYEIRVRATDDSANPAPLYVEETFTITVDEVRDYPFASAGPDQEARTTEEVSLDATASLSPWGDVVYYEWSQLSGTSVVVSNPATAVTTFLTPHVEAPDGESLVFEVHVMDDEGNEDWDVCIVHVLEDNLPPIAEAGDDQLVPGDVEVTLSGLGSSDPENDLDAYQWEQLSGPPVELSSDISSEPTFQSPIPGPKGYCLLFMLTVADNAGLLAQDIVRVIVTEDNLPPVADAGEDHVEYYGAEGVLNGSGSADVEGVIAWYRWRQLAGYPVEIVDPTQPIAVFEAPTREESTGPLTFELTVADLQSLQASDVVTIALAPRPAPAGGGGGGGCSVAGGGAAGGGFGLPWLLAPFVGLLLSRRRRLLSRS
jgi:hypothetical protein